MFLFTFFAVTLTISCTSSSIMFGSGTQPTQEPNTLAPSHPCFATCGHLYLPGPIICRKCMSSFLFQRLLISSTVAPVPWMPTSFQQLTTSTTTPTISSSSFCLKCRSVKTFQINMLKACLQKCPSSPPTLSKVIAPTKKAIEFKTVQSQYIATTPSWFCLRCSQIRVFNSKTFQACILKCQVETMLSTMKTYTAAGNLQSPEYNAVIANSKPTQSLKRTMVPIQGQDVLNRSPSMLYIKSEIIDKVFAYLVASIVCIVFLLIVIIVLLCRKPACAKKIRPFR